MMQLSSRRAARMRARGEQRGAVLVETALVLPILILLVAGIVEFGVGFHESASMAAAARAGARSASAMPKNENFAKVAADAASGQLRGVPDAAPVAVWVYRVAPGTNGPVGAFGSCSDCEGYAWDPANQRFDTTLMLPGSNPWAATSQNACAGVSDQIGVSVLLNHDYFFGVFGSVKTLTRTSIMRLEPFIGSTPCGTGA